MPQSCIHTIIISRSILSYSYKPHSWLVFFSLHSLSRFCLYISVSKHFYMYIHWSLFISIQKAKQVPSSLSSKVEDHVDVPRLVDAKEIARLVVIQPVDVKVCLPYRARVWKEAIGSIWPISARYCRNIYT